MPEVLTLGMLYARFETDALVDDTTKVKCRTAIRKWLKWSGPDSVPGDIDAAAIAAWQRWMAGLGEDQYLGPVGFEPTTKGL